jgi:hypothetical protein
MSGIYRSPVRLLEELGVDEPEEIDLEAIAEHCGATVTYELLSGCAARLLGNGDRAIITVHAGGSPGRRRFSAGHELGHWMRDRHQVAYACVDRAFKEEWGPHNQEQRANRYAAELLLPDAMFKLRVRGKPITFTTVDDLAELFRASRTATAFRLVEIGPLPAMLVCSSSDRRRWFTRSEDVKLWPRERFGAATVAFDLLENLAALAPGPTEVCADGWIDHPEARRYEVVEDSRRIGSELVLSLIWWKDESELLDLEEASEINMSCPEPSR